MRGIALVALAEGRSLRRRRNLAWVSLIALASLPALAAAAAGPLAPPAGEVEEQSVRAAPATDAAPANLAVGGILATTLLAAAIFASGRRSRARP